MDSNSTLPPLSSFPQSYVSEYNGDRLRNIAIAFTVLEVAFVTLRFLSKAIGGTPYGIDDWLMAPALILCMALNAASFGRSCRATYESNLTL